jgi:hypothetical protein
MNLCPTLSGWLARCGVSPTPISIDPTVALMKSRRFMITQEASLSRRKARQKSLLMFLYWFDREAFKECLNSFAVARRV